MRIRTSRDMFIKICLGRHTDRVVKTWGRGGERRVDAEAKFTSSPSCHTAAGRLGCHL